MEGAWSGGEWREGGMGSSAHSPELVVAHILVVTHVLVVTRVLVAREPRWPFWLVVVRASWFVGDGERVIMVVACVVP